LGLKNLRFDGRCNCGAPIPAPAEWLDCGKAPEARRPLSAGAVLPLGGKVGFRRKDDHQDMNLTDRFLKQRMKMVDTQIRARGIADQRVIKAMEKIPRHLFVDEGLIDQAYYDSPLPIDRRQTISQPYIVALMSEAMELTGKEKVLEIGTGSGYQAAVLAEMGGRVFTVERIRKLFADSQALLRKLGYPIRFFYGDGYGGLPAYAPFDRILVTAGAPAVPETLITQLAIGGILVVPVGDREVQVMTRCIRTGEDQFETTTHGSFVFVPMKPGLEER